MYHVKLTHAIGDRDIQTPDVQLSLLCADIKLCLKRHKSDEDCQEAYIETVCVKLPQELGKKPVS